MQNTTNHQALIIHTVTPALTINDIQISADRRGKELPDSDRIRRICIPSEQWGTLAGQQNHQTHQGLTDILFQGLRDLAAKRLRDALEENPMARTVPSAEYTVSALLAWGAETASTRGSITFTRDDVNSWFPTSTLFQRYASRGQATIDFLTQRLGALAAKNHGLKKPEDADKLITLLIDDAATPLVSDMIQRLSHISKSLTAKTTDTISMDDL